MWHNSIHLSKPLFLFACVMLWVCNLQAQETVMLEGHVLNDSIDKAYLHILNLTTQQGTITNEGGVFTIPVHLQDTLFVSAVQLKHKKIIITPEILSRRYIEFHLEEEVNNLPEVNISDINLSGRLDADASGTQVEKIFDPAAAGLPVYTGPTLSIEERRLYEAQHSGGGIVPVGALINALSGRTKMLQKHVEISKMERRVQQARNVFTDSIYTRQFNIPPQWIDDFAHYVYQNKEWRLKYAEDNNPLALIEMLQKLAPEYLEYKKAEKK